MSDTDRDTSNELTDEEYQEAMEQELAKWTELGVDSGQYRPAEGFLGIIFRFETLNKLLVEKGVFTQEEADDMYKGVALSGLKLVRETVIEPAVARAKEEALRARLVPPNGAMHIPRGKRKH